MQVILKGLNIVNPIQNLIEKNDLLIKDGIIAKVGSISDKEFSDSKVYDFEGKYCSPGFFDMHVHLREPGREDTETIKSGCNSAAAGGFTGIASMPNTEPTVDTAEIVKSITEKSKEHLVDVFPIAAVSVNRKGESLAPMAELFEAGAVAFSDDGVSVKTASLLRSAFEYSNMYGAPIIDHCEEESLADGVMNESIVSTILGLPSIPTIAEDIIVHRDIAVAEYTGGKLHIAHISSKKSIEAVREAKKKGVKVTTEVTPHHFTLTDESLKSFDTNLKMNPPLRTRDDMNAILEGLADGTIDCIASDHAPYASEEKEVEFIYSPNGIIGLETELGLALSELYHKKVLSIEQIVEKFAVNPRKILNIEVPKIEEGEIANLTIFDADLIWTVDKTKFKSKSKNTPFDKKLLTGKSLAVINNKQIFIDGKFSEI
ncbi:MAG: dihydroorotase [Ignavibacteriae bacterium]|nr:dihydroorotase [Ignavibacteriota bacterium]NOG97495.1 dihydroorotase [Ignavibacteriota bacterium]